MGEITASANKIYEEEVSYKSAVSEATFTKMGGAINYIISNASDYVGQVECTMLTESQFATIKDYDHTESDLTVKKWVRINGQNITGSDYATLTGITTLPSAVSNEAFPGQTNSEANIGNYEANQNKSHSHSYTVVSATTGTAGGSSGNPYDATTSTSTGPEGGAVARPNTFRVNYFLRINI